MCIHILSKRKGVVPLRYASIFMELHRATNQPKNPSENLELDKSDAGTAICHATVLKSIKCRNCQQDL